MKNKFKPLGLVAAVAAATAGYTGMVSAQEEGAVASGAINSLGDLVLVPYYTVREGFGTGIHLTNTSDRTQVVKVRLRRGADSMDALDFNIVMSPKDVWTGFLNKDEDGGIYMNSQDTSCTVPAMTKNRFKMPDIYREGAEEGYIEMIAMGSPVDEDQAVAIGALHNEDGVPFDCDAVRSNFFSGGVATTKKGVVPGGVQTVGLTPNGKGGSDTLVKSEYEDSGNVLKISYFIRDSQAGLEFGNDGVHVRDFLQGATITNQEFGLASGDLEGFDYPDLDGGSPSSPASRGKYEQLRAALGGVSIINDWSANAEMNVGTDWVITVPGQYTMLDMAAYFQSLQTLKAGGKETYITTDSKPDDGDDVTDLCVADVCDFRDIPLEATFDVYDREEQTLSGPDGELVVSPQQPGEVIRTLLASEVNVVTWGQDPVLKSANAISVQTPDAPFGWAELSVTSSGKTQKVCDPKTTNAKGTKLTSPLVCKDVENTGIPMVGFVAWQRSFDANPDANYGRIVEHSYGEVVVESAP